MEVERERRGEMREMYRRREGWEQIILFDLFRFDDLSFLSLNPQPPCLQLSDKAQVNIILLYQLFVCLFILFYFVASRCFLFFTYCFIYLLLIIS